MEHKSNAYRAETSRSAGSIIRANVFTLFNAIVFACFGVLFALGRWQDALFGFAAIANAIIGSVQEFKAKSALDKLALLNAAPARVRRDGVELEIAQSEVVESDTLVLRAGDQLPADARVVSGRGLQIDESMLTGESDAVDKHPGDDAQSGSIVVGGEGEAQVVGLDAPEGFDARMLPDDDEALAEILEEYTVFGRVTPDQDAQARPRWSVAMRSISADCVAMTPSATWRARGSLPSWRSACAIGRAPSW